MGTLMQVAGVEHTAGANKLFDGIDLSIVDGDRVGLVGHNGSGKTTLLSLLAGTLEPDAGKIKVKRGLNVRQVEQFLPERFARVTLIEAVGGDRWEAEALLDDLGFVDADMRLRVGELSGGQQNRLMFARAVIGSPDLLLLDEPTNHLDLATLVRFEAYLNTLGNAFVLVSHDRAFLDAVTSRTLVLRDQRVYGFAAPYSVARDELAHMDATAARSRASEERKIDTLRQSAKRLALWGRIHDNEKFSRRAKSMEHRVERMEEDKTFVTRGSPLNLDVTVGTARSKEIVRVENLDVRVADTLLFHIGDFLIRPGDRVALLGHNGVGKTTFIKLLVNALAVDVEGVRVSPQTALGYYDQELHEVEGRASMVDFAAARLNVPEQTIRNRFIKAGFPFEVHGKRLDQMSGGERARLLFSVLSLKAPNFLILDEPTNHIDIEGKEQLEDELIAGGATLLITSHDRRFLETVATRFMWIRGGGLEETTRPEEFFASTDTRHTATLKVPRETDQRGVSEDVLERIVEIEEKLETDRARKLKFQKPKLQAAWEAELEALHKRLGEDSS
ncbi:MAG: ABC-F family ATP-binding cassette domain-containing protein [Gammaproteobacteria bacterium]|nr:ABC-F family ATP-binding cassette domain-containing protein [Gammaproteobacteria bacterium]